MAKIDSHGKSRWTLGEIAKRAGVSIATVSNVLNRKGRMSQETSDRIFRIVEELEVGGGDAPADRGKQPANIAFVIADQSGMLSHFSCHLHLIQGMQAVLEQSGFFIKISSCPDVDGFVRETRGVRGAVVMGCPGEDENAYEQNGVPLVWVLGPCGRAADSVQEDSREIARLAVEYLGDLGHRDIGCLVDQGSECQAVRSWHMARMLAERGGTLAIGQGADLLFSRDDPMAVDKRRITELLAELLAARPRPTALFVPSDRMCVTVYAALHEMGVEIPGGLTVLSCDNDIPYLANMTPRPATISLNVDVVGRVAAETILRRLKHPDEPPMRKLVRPGLVRGSSGF